MSPAIEATAKSQLPWVKLAWFGALIVACYFPILVRLVNQWSNDEDMSHGFFVPVVAGFIVWRRREELAATEARPSMWGLLLVGWGSIQLLLGYLATELFTARTALVITLIGAVWTLGGPPFLMKLAFPLGLLFLMVPIPGVIYNQITFPLQILASKAASAILPMFGVPVLREGNVIVLPMMRLEVAEACSGIRSLISLFTLAIFYGYFLDKSVVRRTLLALSSIPIAIGANAIRIVGTGLCVQYWDPDKAVGFFH